MEASYDGQGRPDELPLEEESEVDSYNIGPTVLRSEVEAAMKTITSGKAEGTDGIPGEMIKMIEEAGKEALVNVCP